MKPIISISSCILGNKVRYDGGDTYNEWISQKLQLYFELKAVCPEMEMGLGSPREPMNLILDHLQKIQLVTTQTKKNLTAQAHLTILKIIEQEKTGICGHIFQQKSPSCGLNQVKLYNAKDELIITSQNNLGLYALSFTQNFPLIPVIDAIELANIESREHFLRRVLAYSRFHLLPFSLTALLDFHLRYEHILLEHNQAMTKQLKTILINTIKDDDHLVFSNYKLLFFQTLCLIPCKNNIIDSLNSLVGLLRLNSSPEEEELLIKILNEYKNNQTTYKKTIKKFAHIVSNNKKHCALKEHYLIDPDLTEL